MEEWRQWNWLYFLQKIQIFYFHQNQKSDLLKKPQKGQHQRLQVNTSVRDIIRIKLKHVWGLVLWAYSFNTLNTDRTPIVTPRYSQKTLQELNINSHNTLESTSRVMQLKVYTIWKYMWIHIPEELRDLSGLDNSKIVMNIRKVGLIFLQSKVSRK